MRVAGFFESRPTVRAVVKAACITALALMLSSLLVSPFTASTSMLMSSPEQSDFRFSDIFAQVADSRPVRQLDPNIVIVDIANSNRSEIAQTLMEISLCNPKAVAVDVLFAQPHDDDTDLLDAISSVPGIIMAYSVEADNNGGKTFHTKDKPFFMDSLRAPAVVYAATNLPTEDSGNRGRVRQYAVGFPTAEGDTVDSFAAAIARAFNPESLATLRHKDAERGYVGYHSREFTVIPSGQLLDRASELDGKIAIVGSLTDAGDMHATPINSYFAGVMIHAYSLATILDGTWYTDAPVYVDYICAILICFFFVFLCLTMKHPSRGMLVRVLQVVLLYATVRIGYSLYVDSNVICSFSNTILMIAFGLFAVDLWNGVTALGQPLKSKLIILYSKIAPKQCEEFS